MKKIASIIDNCKKCPSCQRFNPQLHGLGAAFICGEATQLLKIGQSIDRIEIPSWCPLETYEDDEQSESQPETAPCNIGQSKSEEKARDTIILPGLPHLEWMTENLSGHGGTEIDGQTYYTYEEAVEAVKQLGDGWRLPTRGEMLDLDDLGSEWQENGPHGLPGRLFGGGLFLDAAGCRNRASGALGYVGERGHCWSSSSYAAGNVSAGCLYFLAGYVNPLNYGNRAHGFSVRCVRNH